MYFGHKYVETGPNYSHEFATFFKYHVPLRTLFMLKKNNFPFLMKAKLSSYFKTRRESVIYIKAVW